MHGDFLSHSDFFFVREHSSGPFGVEGTLVGGGLVGDSVSDAVGALVLSEASMHFFVAFVHSQCFCWVQNFCIL